MVRDVASTGCRKIYSRLGYGGRGVYFFKEAATTLKQCKVRKSIMKTVDIFQARDMSSSSKSLGYFVIGFLRFKKLIDFQVLKCYFSAKKKVE